MRRWIALALCVALAGLTGVIVAHGSSGPSAVKAAALGNARFDRSARSCTLRRLRPRSTKRPSESLLLGVSAGIRLYHGPGRCEETRLAADTGIQAVREDLSWSRSEPHPNVYDWSDYDGVVRAAASAGLAVLPVLGEAPRWAAPEPTCLPSETGPYASFTAAVVGRYGPGGEFWRANPELPQHPLVWYELWNEPWNATCNRDPGLYARLVAAAATAGRAVTPAARFLIEGDTFYQTLAGARADWIAGMYAGVPKLGSYFDALAIHPYGGDPAIYTPAGNTDGQPGRLEQAHEELVARGDGNKPLWVTEIGWTTCAGTYLCVTDAEQASYLETFLRSASTTWRAYVRAVFVFGLRDIGPNPPENREAWFGLLRPDLSRKPAWWVLHDAALGLPRAAAP